MEQKKIFVIDDSETDRMILNEILKNDFEVEEKSNGYEALDHLMNTKIHYDCILLDLKMPILNGFEVLKLMQENNIKTPVFLITAEATKDNVARAAQYGINGFIAKPYKPVQVLERLRSFFNMEMLPDEEDAENPYEMTEERLMATNEYILRLNGVYDAFLNNIDITDIKYRRIADVVEIMLRRYAEISSDYLMDEEHITLASQASYFYDIGMMCVPNSVTKVSSTEITGDTSHTVNGSKIICLNQSELCRYFVDCCSDICMHHHEKWDGSGFPHGLAGDDIKMTTQITSLVLSFDEIFMKRTDFNERNFDFTIKELSIKAGCFSDYVFSILDDCCHRIVKYYAKNFKPFKL